MCEACCKAENEKTVRTCTECGFDVDAKGMSTEEWCGRGNERCSVCHHTPCDGDGVWEGHTSIYDYM